MKIGWFLTKLRGFIARVLQKKTFKNYFFVTTPSMKFPFNSCPQKPPFSEHENANISGTACPNLKKIAHSEIHSLKGFNLSYTIGFFLKNFKFLLSSLHLYIAQSLLTSEQSSIMQNMTQLLWLEMTLFSKKASHNIEKHS